MGSPPAATNGMLDDYVIEDRERDVQQLFKHKDIFDKLAGFKRINDSDFIPIIEDTIQRFGLKCDAKKICKALRVSAFHIRRMLNEKKGLKHYNAAMNQLSQNHKPEFATLIN